MTACFGDMQRIGAAHNPNPENIAASRASLDVARRSYLLALHEAIAAGMPDDELAHDVGATARAARQLVEMSAGAA